MPSINLIKSSDGTGDAAVATVTTVRAPGSTTIVVDTVDNIPTNFMGSMGTPHTFVDPITSETITVISEATARDFKGSVVSTHLEITAMAPGYVDDIGSAVGDVVIIKPTTEWANNIAAVLDVEHNDDGTHGAVTATSATVAGAATVGGNLTVTGQSRVVAATTTSGSTITPTAQVYDVTALAVPATIAVPSFTAQNGLCTIIRIKDNGTARALTFAAGYVDVSGIGLPTTTVAGKLLTIGAMYNSTTSKWEVQGINQQA